MKCLNRVRSQCMAFAALLLSMSIISGCVTTTGKEANQEFAERMKQYGTNPYINAQVFKDLERRIRAIAAAKETTANPRELGPRQLEILNNFSDRYDHKEFTSGMLSADLSYSNSKAPSDSFRRLKDIKYGKLGNETGCKIDTVNSRFPRNNTPVSYNWSFVKGNCKGGLAHGVGLAVADSAKFYGEFDQGRMVRGLFETVNSKGGWVVSIGDVPSTDLIGRTLFAVFRKDGFHWYRYGDFNGDSKFHGFGLNIFSYPKVTVVRNIGDFKNGSLHGFGSHQYRKSWGDGKVWNVWIGIYENGSLSGAGAWTNAMEELDVGEWKNGKRNGVGYTQYNDSTGDYHMFDACNYVNNKREGMCKVFHSNSFNSGEHVWERYNGGEMVDASYNQTAFSLDQILAFSMGAAIISASDAPSAAKMQVGKALFQDTLGGGGGSNLAALKSSYEQQALRANSNASSSTSSGTSTTSSAGSGLTTEQVNISCPSGVSNTIPITYRTRACYIAAKQFAETYSCNKLDFERVATNCQRLCGHPQCLQK